MALTPISPSVRPTRTPPADQCRYRAAPCLSAPSRKAQLTDAMPAAQRRQQRGFNRHAIAHNQALERSVAPLCASCPGFSREATTPVSSHPDETGRQGTALRRAAPRVALHLFFADVRAALALRVLPPREVGDRRWRHVLSDIVVPVAQPVRDSKSLPDFRR